MQSDHVGLALLKEDLVSSADHFRLFESDAVQQLQVKAGKYITSLLICAAAAQVGAVRLFFTPEEAGDPQNHAKRHFLQTGK